jgi:hypothetical protein
MLQSGWDYWLAGLIEKASKMSSILPNKGKNMAKQQQTKPAVVQSPVSAKAEPKAKKASACSAKSQGFKNDSLFPRIQRAVSAIGASGKVVTPIDVLVRMELLKPAQVEDWRLGRVAYLERVINCNLTRLGRILRILRAHALDLKLKPSHTAYCRWGKRGHKAPLRFSKSGDRKLEEAYSCHFVRKGGELVRVKKAGPESVGSVAVRSNEEFMVREAVGIVFPEDAGPNGCRKERNIGQSL